MTDTSDNDRSEFDRMFFPDKPVVDTRPEFIRRFWPDPNKPREQQQVPHLIASNKTKAYATAAFNAEIDLLARAGDGQRNDQLNLSAFALSQLVAGGYLDREDTWAALHTTALSVGLTETETQKTLRSGFTAGELQPREVPQGEGPPPATVLHLADASVDTSTGEVVEGEAVPGDVTRGRFPRLDLAALLTADRPPREWVIDGLVPAGASVALVAPAGTGKSLLLLAAVIAVARGDSHFAGLGITRRRVLLVDMENTEDDLADRLKALGVTPEMVGDLDELVTIHLPPLAALDTPLGATDLALILDAYGAKWGDVLVLDSLQRVISGAENDSDTMRAFYRCTGVMLKRRGITVIRTDNTGKDADKGARGTSGKRDDVDVELILTRDGEGSDRLRIRPGKVRIPGIEAVLISRDVDDDGLLTYSTAADPFRVLVAQAHHLLDHLAVPLDAGERPAAEAVRRSGHTIVRAALRVALKERRKAPQVLEIAAPKPLGAPGSADE